MLILNCDLREWIGLRPIVFQLFGVGQASVNVVSCSRIVIKLRLFVIVRRRKVFVGDLNLAELDSVNCELDCIEILNLKRNLNLRFAV